MEALLHNLSLITAGNNLQRLFSGLWVSMYVALVSMGISIVFGVLLGVAMTSKKWWMIAWTRLYVEFFRLMPQIVLLFVVFFNSSRVFGLDMTGSQAAIIVFTLWGTAEMGDLVRGAITSVPKHQYESAAALALRQTTIFRVIILPQAVRQLIPQTVNLTTRMIKTTPLVTLIGVVEILKVSQQIIDANRFEYPQAALWIYGFVFVIYFVMCFVISLYARYLEGRAATAKVAARK